MLTERDLEILRFINQFGFCEMPHLNQRFKLNKPYNYELMNKLVKKGMVLHQAIFHLRHGVYRLTKKGAELTDLPPIKKVPIAIYDHETLLIQLYFKLMEKHPDANWISERQLSWEKFFDGLGKRGHVPDGLLIFNEGKKVAIELELTLKGRRRIEKILNHYATQFEIEEVWYFCSERVIPTLTELAAKKTFVKIFNLKDILNAKS